MSEELIRHRKRVVRRHYRHKDDENNELDIPDVYEQPPRRNNSARAEKNLICNVCDGLAHGYNFDTITCESCKAFFRRNALRPNVNEKFKCRNGDDRCPVTVATRKRCKACRLAKCFAKGMRADWILTEEERVNKRQKIEENRRLRQMLYPDSDELVDFEGDIDLFGAEHNMLDPPPGQLLLSAADSLKLTEIQQSYTESVRLTSLPREIPSYPHTARIQETWCLMNLPGNLQSTRLITFFKLLPEFTSLNDHDKLILIKYHTFALLFIRSALLYDPATDSYHDQGTDDCVFDNKDLIRCFGLQQYQQTTRCVCQVMDATQKDPVIVRLLLLINLFSKGSAILVYSKEAEPVAADVTAILYRQNFFVDLLWKYLEDKYGSTKTIDIWLKLVMATNESYLQAYITRSNYCENDRVVDQLVPLMQSVILNV